MTEADLQRTIQAKDNSGEDPFRRGDLDSLFKPDGIAVIGASSDARKIGGRPIHFLRTQGYSGGIYPINPNQSEIQGLPAFPSLGAVPGTIDQAIIVLPAAGVPDAIDSCIARKVRTVIVFSAGFAEQDAAGQQAQDRIAARCRDNGVRLLGPNCMGAVSVAAGVYSTFSHSLEFGMPSPGPISMVSQSGAVGSFALVKAVQRRLGFCRFVATGNEADIDFADCIEWFSQDPELKVILGYFESCRDGRRLAEVLEKARLARKPVILLKGGASEIGAAAAASHTGALAGTDKIYDAVFDAVGACRVQSIDEMLDVAYACSHSILPAGRRLGVITGSGGAGVLLADAAVAAGMSLPPVPAEAQAIIKSVLPFATPTNPVDVTAHLLNDFTIVPRILAAMLGDRQFDGLVAFFGSTGLDPHIKDRLRDTLIAARRQYPDCTFTVCILAERAVQEAWEAEGLLVFEDLERAIRALARMAQFREAFDRGPAFLPPAAPGARLPGEALDEAAAKRLLTAAGIPFPLERTAATAAEAIAAAQQIGLPVALKILSADITHKSEVGGVLLDLGTAEMVSDGFHRIIAAARQARPDADIGGVIVAPMVRGVETVMGLRRDPLFGPVVMFGLGGVYVEILQDVAFSLAPIDEVIARRMIESIQGYPLLAGARGRPAIDIAALASALAALSRFGADHGDVAEIDINPFIALPKGGYGVDALIVPASTKA